MKQVTMFQTMDGKLHSSVKDAENHTNKVYGDLLGSISRNLVQLNGKYSPTCDWINVNLDSFKRLIALNDDMILENTEEDLD